MNQVLKRYGWQTNPHTGKPYRSNKPRIIKTRTVTSAKLTGPPAANNKNKNTKGSTHED